MVEGCFTSIVENQHVTRVRILEFGETCSKGRNRSPKTGLRVWKEGE